MYFIDLSLRNPVQGYVDSVALIAEVTGAPEIYVLWEEAERFAAIDSDDATEALHDILMDAEDIAGDYGFHASAHEGFQYVMTHDAFEEWWGYHEVG